MADEEVAAPEPVEEVEMSVLDALKEVSWGLLGDRHMVCQTCLSPCCLRLSYYLGSPKGHDPWWTQEGSP